MAEQGNEYLPQSVTHPSITLAEKLQELGMDNNEFAMCVGEPEIAISALTNGTSRITTEMAVKFESVLKIPATFWLARQRRYDEFRIG